MRRASPLILPCCVLLLAVAAVQSWARPRLPASFWSAIPAYSWFILAAGTVIAWGFQRGRVALGLLALGLAGEALRLPAAGPLQLTASQHALCFDLVSILLPLNLAAAACLGERALLTLRGFLRLALLPLQAGAVILACVFQWPELAAAARHEILSLPFKLATPLHQPALLAFVFASAVVLLRFYRQSRPIEAAFVAALGGAFLALHVPGPASRLPLAVLFFAAAQTVLVLGLLLNSHAMAYRDELTGLPSRRALSEFLPQLGRQYAVAMVDVDHFKKFNDRYGHDAGDQVLRMVAARLSQVPGPGRVFRYGGEEFTIIFPGKELDETVDHLEHIRKTIETGGFTLRGPQRPRRIKAGHRPRGPRPSAKPPARVRVTVSMGVAETGARLVDPQSVIKAADKALYRAKRAGRNQISD